MPPKPFSFTHFHKSTSANPLESHSFKTKDLKPFCFTHFQKKVGWTPCFPPDAHLQSPVTNHKSLRLTPLDATLTSERAAKSFSCNTYKKQGWGRGPGPGARQNNEGGLAPQVTGQTSQLTAQKVSITSFQFRVSTFGLVFSGGPYFPGPRPNARE